MMWWTVWWIWLAAALVMAILEVVVPAYIFLGFAVGAAITGLAVAVGITAGLSMSWMLVVFAVLSLLGYIAVRFAFGAPGGSVKIWDRDIND